MSLLKAFSKYMLRSLNDCKHNKDINRAKQKAFANTKSAINKAKDKGYYINAKSFYKSNLYLQTLKAKNKYINRDKFINDL